MKSAYKKILNIVKKSNRLIMYEEFLGTGWTEVYEKGIWFKSQEQINKEILNIIHKNKKYIYNNPECAEITSNHIKIKLKYKNLDIYC